jgi:glycosyltransferase involved in cell wall biosynthesis
MQPLLSVVIPTHNRSHYAYYAIRSILSIKDDRIEIVISDTSGDDKLFKMLSIEGELLISDPRMKLIRPIEKLDMTGNHNTAVAAATGEYVCLIGDDDTITQDALAATAWAKLNGVEIIAPDVVSNYAWPDFLSIHFGSKHSSRLYIPKTVSGIIWHNSKDALNNALKNAAQGTDGLPKIYHGIVKRSLLEKIKDLTGNYFYGSSPDVSGAIGLVLCSEKFVSLKYPLTIPGASGGSNTGRSAMNKHKGKLSSEAQTKSFENGGWSKGVPKFFSVETVWAHAALETIKRISPDQVIHYNYVKLFASCTILHPEYSLEIKQAIAETSLILGLSISKLKSQIRAERFKLRWKRFRYICRRLLHPTASGGRLFISGLETIESAPEALKKHMKENGWDWENIIHRI